MAEADSAEPEMNGDGPEAPTAARAEKTRRKLSESGRRVLFIVLGLIVLVGSVLGFYLTSDAFDDRVAVLIAARDLQAGEILTSDDLSPALVVVGPIPYVPWNPFTRLDFDGKVTLQAIPAGALILDDHVTDAETVPVGVELEVIVPLDTSLATDGVLEGDDALLVDRGAEPAESDPGRPRKVVRQFTLTNFDGSRMRLFLAPEEWAEWSQLLDDVGGSLMVVPIGIGGDADETTQRLNAVWEAQWKAAVVAVERVAIAIKPSAGPGELEVVVSLDASLVPSGVSDGELVLLIDPGVSPLGNNAGRARSVIGTLQLENFEGGQIRLFVPPEEWLHWRLMPDRLGASPMVLPVADGTDVDDMIQRLNELWLQAHEAAGRAQVTGP
ncbi:SAF domain-containing protein [Candidatus Poriferisodalis sp.]|uniref:SAF domain-containing protein n=1 Tax=Candidatus Poriferisodalis sp. TaxID=3101277 RepID=UPI003B529389